MQYRNAYDGNVLLCKATQGNIGSSLIMWFITSTKANKN